MAVGAPTLEQLVEAAEHTISAAAAAIVWAGGASGGVFEHVAAADPWLMARTRLAYNGFVGDEPYPSKVHRRLEQAYLTATEIFEVAALPCTVAHPWTSRVNRAFLSFGATRKSISPSDNGPHATRTLIESAFHACRKWALDPMDIGGTLSWAENAQVQADRLWRSNS
ncbi:hypothetical protein [Mycobacterium paraterrae]|uniref:Uncharacterized protein n=1 Tax=Mycobacterium paraterrae TaxID=577492 RepID=A0ABY3VSE4_9MYCO|nr:hypothetical protein [Mycobacterium paraterrae]UMB70097.1 hypothetical protein MKK62_01740 [Mycobacterium paraterrae]